MQSFTTQAHARNYQGNVILQTQNQATKTKRHHPSSLIMTICLALVIAITSTLLGVVTVHNQQLEREIQTLETQLTPAQAEQPCENCIPCNVEMPTKKRGKTLPRIPISNQQQDTEPMPSVENTLH